MPAIKETAEAYMPNVSNRGGGGCISEIGVVAVVISK